MKKTIPQNAGEFLNAIQDELGSWQVAIEPAEPEDCTCSFRTVFRLANDVDGLAYVAHEHGRMIVTIDKEYHFDLSRINEGRGVWPWSKQLAEKEWVCSSKMSLVINLQETFNTY